MTNSHLMCGDFLYSGHTVMLTLTYLFIKECEYSKQQLVVPLLIVNILLYGTVMYQIIDIIIIRHLSISISIICNCLLFEQMYGSYMFIYVIGCCFSFVVFSYFLQTHRDHFGGTI